MSKDCFFIVQVPAVAKMASPPPEQQEHPPQLEEEEQQLLKAANSPKPEQSVAEPSPSRYTSAPFLWFVAASSILPLLIVVLLFMMRTPDTPFSLAFALGIVTSITGGAFFFTYLWLKDELVEVYAHNQKHRMHADTRRRDNRMLTRAQFDLKDTAQQLIASKQEMKHMLRSLQMLNFENVEQLKESSAHAQRVYRRWHESLLIKERELLHTLYDRYELRGHGGDADVEGLDKQHFDAFVAGLPDGYQQRLERLGAFDKVECLCTECMLFASCTRCIQLSNGGGIITYDDFQVVLDLFAEMEVDDVDIDFEIGKEQALSPTSGQNKVKPTIARTEE